MSKSLTVNPQSTQRPLSNTPNHGEVVDGIQSNSSPLTLSNQCANISRLSAAEFRGKKVVKMIPLHQNLLFQFHKPFFT